MEFRILGPLEVSEGDRPVALAGTRTRALLALLLTSANDVVSSDRLIDELWGAQPPRSAANALQYHVSRLRKALVPADVIVTREPGYLIKVEPDQLDLLRFERLVSGAQNCRRRRPHGSCAQRSLFGAARRSPISSDSHSPGRRSAASRSFASPLSSSASGRISRSVDERSSSASSTPSRENSRIGKRSARN